MVKNERNLDESDMFAVCDEESLENTDNILKRFCDGEPVNKNPLTEIPQPEMQLYYINGHYFDTLNDLREYCSSKGISMDDFDIVSYLRNCAGHSDVIMKKYRNGKIMFWTAVDEDGYGMYDNESSIYRGEFVWDY